MGEERTVIFQLPTMISGELECIQGTVAGQKWPLSAGTFVIGRASDSDLCLSSEPGVSKVHAKIIATETEYSIVDAESRNGTIVNRRPIRKARLRDGDQIQICGCVLTFTQSGGSPEQSVVRNEFSDEGFTDEVPVLNRNDQEPPAKLVVENVDVVDAASASVPAIPKPTPPAPPAPAVAPSIPEEKRPAQPAEPEQPSAASVSAQQIVRKEVSRSALPYLMIGFLSTITLLGGFYIITVQNALQTSSTVTQAKENKPAESGQVKVDKEKTPPVETPGKEGAKSGQNAQVASSEAKPGGGPSENTGASAQSATPGQMNKTIWYGVKIIEAKAYPVRTPYGGRVKSVQVSNGDTVAKGQSLFTVQGKAGNRREVETLKLSIRALEDVVNASGNKRAKKALDEERAKLKAIQSKAAVYKVTSKFSGTLNQFSVQAGETVRAKQYVGRVKAKTPTKITVDVDSELGFSLTANYPVTVRLDDGTETAGTVQKTQLLKAGSYTVFLTVAGVAPARIKEVKFK